MAKTLYLPDGAKAVLLQEEDFYLLIGAYLGRSAEDIVRTLANRINPGTVKEIILKEIT